MDNSPFAASSFELRLVIYDETTQDQGIDPEQQMVVAKLCTEKRNESLNLLVQNAKFCVNIVDQDDHLRFAEGLKKAFGKELAAKIKDLTIRFTVAPEELEGFYEEEYFCARAVCMLILS